MLTLPTKSVSGAKSGLRPQILADPLVTNLVGWYQFLGNTNDSSSSGNTGTIVGSPTLVSDHAGTPNSAYSFNGASYVSVAHNSNLPIFSHTSPFSVAFWVKGSGASMPSDARVFAEGSSVSNNPLFTFSVVNTTKLRTLLRNEAGTFVLDVWSAADVFDDAWHHIVWAENGNSARLYIDGNLDNAFTYTAQSLGTFNRTTIGALVRAGATNFFTGSISDVRLYQRQLTLADAVSLAGGNTILPIYWNQSPPAGISSAPIGEPSGFAIDQSIAPLATNELWDNFDGAAATKPSTTLWVVDTIFQGGMQTHSVNQCYLDGNGNAVLEAIRNAGPPVTYVTGRFTSRTKFNMTWPCWCAARAKMVSGVHGPGISSAVWQLSTGYPNSPSAELDIMEYSSTSPFVFHSTAHATNPSYAGTQWPQKQYTKTNPDIITDGQYHTWWMLREENRIMMGIDDFVMGTWTPSIYTDPIAFENLRVPFFWNLTLGIGGWLGAPTGATVFPAHMLIDWIWYKPL